MDIYAHQIYYSEVNVCRARRTTVITKGSTYATCARARNYRSREAYFSARVHCVTYQSDTPLSKVCSTFK